MRNAQVIQSYMYALNHRNKIWKSWAQNVSKSIELIILLKNKFLNIYFGVFNIWIFQYAVSKYAVYIKDVDLQKKKEGPPSPLFHRVDVDRYMNMKGADNQVKSLQNLIYIYYLPA